MEFGRPEPLAAPIESGPKGRFLVSLLPKESRVIRCRFIAHTVGTGPAYACLYTWHNRHILVAQYLRGKDRNTDAEVVLGETFSSTEAATP